MRFLFLTNYEEEIPSGHHPPKGVDALPVSRSEVCEVCALSQNPRISVTTTTNTHMVNSYNYFR
ncbi:MAG TPA: hypothetical protein O0X84_06395 [Methanocorpusculum sp.]|nr:hypothetical protein [Methanocorpusculum sp.]